MAIRKELLIKLLPRLEEDYQFKASSDGEWLNQGICPNCGKRELFTNTNNPYYLKCGRENKCGALIDTRDLYPDLFGDLNKRYAPTPTNPSATADAYMELARGLPLNMVRGLYEQGSYYHPHGNIGTATVKFWIDRKENVFMERFIEPVTIEDEETGETTERRANFKGAHKGRWWAPAILKPKDGDTIWLVEGCIDALALHCAGIKAVAVLSCGNFPEIDLKKHAKKHITWVWALDNDQAGKNATLKQLVRAKALNLFDIQVAINHGPTGEDWNDLYCANKLSQKWLDEYLYHGQLLTAKSAIKKGQLIYEHSKKSAFAFDFNRQLYWFNFDLEKYDNILTKLEDSHKDKGEFVPHTELQEMALAQSGGLVKIANCQPQFLYYQRNIFTDDAWYYLSCQNPQGGKAKNTFTGTQLSSANEFKKRLLSIMPGALFTGKVQHLDYLLEHQAVHLKTVQAIDFVGYSKEFAAYIFPDVAIKNGKVYEVNEDDYFELPQGVAIKSLYKPHLFSVSKNARDYRQDWSQLLWQAFGEKGVIVAAFWFGSLFAEQVRALQSSFPFLEIVGEPGSGKTTLIEFCWRLFGQDKEGIDPNKGTRAGLDRALAQYSNMPNVFIEADRAEDSSSKNFDWDETKPYYNGRGMRVRGMRNNTNETNEPPFRGTLVIAQNEPVAASDAVLERIIQLRFNLNDHSPESRQAVDVLTQMDISQLSYFLRLALVREKQVVNKMQDKLHSVTKKLLSNKALTHARLAKNHAQLIILTQLFGDLVGLSQEQINQSCQMIQQCALDRQQAVECDTPLVTEFWEVYQFIESRCADGCTLLNHSMDENLIAINLNHFAQLASEYRQSMPALADLKRHLKTSKRIPYVQQAVVRSAILKFGNSDLNTKPRNVRCWIFKKR